MSEITNTFDVVMNDEGQYSVWSAERPVPAFWHKLGVSGKYDECLDYIENTWTDMRPRSLLHEISKASVINVDLPRLDQAVDLCRRILGQHAVDIRLRREQTFAALCEEIQSGSLQLTFGDEFNRADILLEMAPPATGWNDGNCAHFAGTMVIDGVPFVAELSVDVSTLKTIAVVALARADGSE